MPIAVSLDLGLKQASTAQGLLGSDWNLLNMWGDGLALHSSTDLLKLTELWQMMFMVCELYLCNV